jgi:hypothetical protein
MVTILLHCPLCWPLGISRAASTGVPDQKQRVLDLRSILSRTWMLKCLLHLFCMVEEPPRIFTIGIVSFDVVRYNECRKVVIGHG